MLTRLLPLCLALSACAPSVADFVEARREVATARLARIFEARDQARTAPDIFEDTLGDPGPLSLCDLMVPPFRDAPCNTWAIDMAQLEKHERYLESAVVTFGQAEWLVLTKSLLDTGRFPPNDKYPEGAVPDRVIRIIEHAFRWLDNVRYLIIVDTDEVVAPDITPDVKAYTAGRYEGVARLYALEPSVRLLGGIRFDFSMTGDIKVKLKRGQVNKAELIDAFSRAVRVALVEKLQTRLRQLEPAPQ